LTTTKRVSRRRRQQQRLPKQQQRRRQSPVDGVRLVELPEGVQGPKGRYGIEMPVTEPTLVRMPIVHEAPGSRPLLESFPTDSAISRAVMKHLNPVLEAIGIGAIKTNVDTNKVYVASMDGTAVEAWISDLYAGLVDETPVTNVMWALTSSSSTFLAAIANTLKNLDAISQYGELIKSLKVLKHWAVGMKLALKYKPEKEDYPKVKEALALYVASKLHRWPKSNTWYDNECQSARSAGARPPSRST